MKKVQIYESYTKERRRAILPGDSFSGPKLKKKNKDPFSISVINDSQEIPFNDQEVIPENEEAPDELKTPKQVPTKKIWEELKKKSLLMHQLKDSGMLTDVDKKNMEKIDHEIKEQEAQMKRLKWEAIRQKRDERYSNQRLLQQQWAIRSSSS